MDLKVWIGEAEQDVYKVITSHYMKEVSSRAVINEKSSHPRNMKKNVLVNEALRIFRNSSKFLKWEETAEHLSYLMKRLQFSCYDQRFRHEVMKAAFKKYDTNKEAVTGTQTEDRKTKK